MKYQTRPTTPLNFSPKSGVKCLQKILYVKDVPIEIQESSLYYIFRQYGEILELSEYLEPDSISSSRPTSKSVLVHFRKMRIISKEQIVHVSLGGLSLKATVIHGKLSNRCGMARTHKVYIGNLPSHKKVSMIDLLKVFLAFGPIQYIYPVLHTRSKVCKGFGFVGFLDKKSAKKAVKKCRNIKMGVFERIFCDYKKADFTNGKKCNFQVAKSVYNTDTNNSKSEDLYPKNMTFSTKPLYLDEESGEDTKKLKEKELRQWNSTMILVCRYGSPLKLLEETEIELVESQYQYV